MHVLKYRNALNQRRLIPSSTNRLPKADGANRNEPMGGEPKCR